MSVPRESPTSRTRYSVKAGESCPIYFHYKCFDPFRICPSTGVKFTPAEHFPKELAGLIIYPLNLVVRRKPLFTAVFQKCVFCFVCLFSFCSFVGLFFFFFHLKSELKSFISDTTTAILFKHRVFIFI